MTSDRGGGHLVQGKVAAAGWYATMLLSMSYVLSFIDRMILGLLVDPIKKTFAATDLQIGLLFGASFAIIYSIAGIPLGSLADRISRRNLIAAALLIWSALTVLSSMATGLAMLIVLRFGVAIGEAALSPSAVSMISDMFSKQRRALPLSIYFASGMLGIGLAFTLGALVLSSATGLHESGAVSMAPWRLTLLIVGAPGVVLAMLILTTLKEPLRTRDLNDLRTGQPGGWREVASLFWGPRVGLGLLFMGSALVLLPTTTFAAWVPTMLMREYGWTAARSGVVLGLVFLATAPTSHMLSSFIVNKLSRDGARPAIFPYFGATVAALGLATFLAMTTLKSAALFLAAVAAANLSLLGMGAVASIAVPLLLPNAHRGQAIAVFLFVTYVCGFAWGPPLVAVVAEHVGGANALSTAIAFVGIGSVMLGAVFFLASASSFKRRFTEHLPAVRPQAHS
jgi:MFS family permease